jgi:23S rRNA (cytosine1962-C5)-methyltransferase
MGWSGKALPESWVCSVQGLSLQLKPTDFGHVGVFPEHQEAWKWLEKHSRPGIRVLNLFAYSGVASLIAARAGAEVCHVDSSSGMVRWARENAAANQLEDAPIRWIVDDARKFLARELRRERQYELILLDPPSFGRGKKGEVFKIEDELTQLLADCVKLLAPKNAGLFLSCHTPGMTPIVLEHLLRQSAMGRSPTLESGEMLLPGSQGVFSIPSGAYARWHD